MKKYIATIRDNGWHALVQFEVWGDGYADAERTAQELRKSLYKDFSGALVVDAVT